MSESGPYYYYGISYILQEVQTLVRQEVDEYLQSADRAEIQMAARSAFEDIKRNMAASIYQDLSAEAKAVHTQQTIKDEIVLYVTASLRVQKEVVGNKSSTCHIL